MLKRLIDGTFSVHDYLTDFSNNLLASQGSSNGNGRREGGPERLVLDSDIADLCYLPYTAQLTRSNLRLVLFSEHGGRLIYDTSTVIALSDRVLPNSNRSSCGKFQFLPHREDTAQLLKMVFGTLNAGCNRAGSIKIHQLPASRSLMLTSVFSVPKPGSPLSKGSSPPTHEPLKSWMVSSISSSSESDHQHNNQYQSTVRSLDALRRYPHNHCDATSVEGRSQTALSSYDPLEGGFVRLRNCSLQIDEFVEEDEENSGKRRIRNIRAKAGSPGMLSRQRRRQLSLLGLDRTASITGVASAIGSLHSIISPPRSGEGGEETNTRRYAAAIIFPGEEHQFIFQHILQLERDIHALLATLKEAIESRSLLFSLIFEAWKKFSTSISLLHDSPRLVRPAWLSLTSDPLAQEKTASEFCSTLARLSKVLNTKETRFFLSTLVSAVLTNHLAWVASVVPPEVHHRQHSDRPLLLGTCTIEAQRSPYYNPILAQLMDLTGGVGNSKVVVLGGDKRMVAEILFLLSYFVRCSSIQYQGENSACAVSALSTIPRTVACQQVLSYQNGNIADLSPTTVDVLQPVPTDLLGTLSASADGQVSNSTMSVKQIVKGPDKPEYSGCESGPTPVETIHKKRCDLKDLGRSLLAGVCCDFSPHFVLSGINKSSSTNEKLYDALLAEVTNGETVHCSQSMDSSSSNKDMGEFQPIGAASEMESTAGRKVVVVGDVAQHRVKVLSNESGGHVEDGEVLAPSETVASMIEEFVELYETGCIPTFLISFIEDRLRAIFEKSSILVQLVSATDAGADKDAAQSSATATSQHSDSPPPPGSISSNYSTSPPVSDHEFAPPLATHNTDVLSSEHASVVLGCECSDLKLLINVASTYFPPVLSSVL